MPELSTLGSTIKTAYEGEADAFQIVAVPTNETTPAGNRGEYALDAFYLYLWNDVLSRWVRVPLDASAFTT